MQFVKFTGIIRNADFLRENENRQESRRLILSLSNKSANANQRYGSDAYFFITDISDDVITCGALAQSSKLFRLNIGSFVSALDLDITDISETEITFSTFASMLNAATRQDYIDDDDEVLEQFGLAILTSRWGRGLDYGENVISPKSQDVIFKETEKYLANETLVPELKRIASTTVKPGVYGHPVHYMVETDSKTLRKKLYGFLINSLYNSGRIDNRRYAFIDINPEDDFSMRALESLYNSCQGGVIVIRYDCRMSAGENEYATPHRRTIEKLCTLMRRNRNKILTVFCLGRECNAVKSLFYENLENICFVNIREDLAEGDQARNYLKMLAKDNNIRSDKALMSRVETDHFYLSNQLQEIFDEWYDHKLRNKVFPEYRNSIAIKKVIQKEKPKGSAYDELMEMVGIDNAKAVMRQALDYHKARKLFKDKGMSCDTMPMHMCFTGNPGTAKTSCARLFARILFENGIIKNDNINELTANELKAKYVGHTAPLVKQKFRESMGGVLFLDEAYSLVDDRDGSFGDEALACIISEMENHREDVICIFAGYSDKMEAFLRKNPGMRSRIQFHVNFDDYSVDELCDISRLIAKKMKLTLTDGAVEKLRVIYGNAISEHDFGNGRFARNIIEQARMHQCSRLVSMDYDKVKPEDLTTITAEDIEIPKSAKSVANNIIGFCA